MKKGKLTALFPLLFFVVVYLSLSAYLNDFYRVPILVVFLFSLFFAFIQFPRIPFDNKVRAFIKGAGDENIVLMILIFLLAGGFGEVSKDMGAISSIVNFSLNYLSPQIIIAGLFVIAAFISTSLGTSVGTVAALGPLAVGLGENISGALPVTLAAVIGGAMFGDNLSFISDTTIAATRTQGIGMQEKFRANIRIVWLPFLITLCIYLFFGGDMHIVLPDGEGDYHWLKVLPYILVFLLALLGLNVVKTLIIGILVALVTGFHFREFTFLEALRSLNAGMAGMFELSMICLVIGGIVGIIRLHGGIDYLLFQITRRIDSRRKAELGIALLTGMVNLSIANNTITIIIVGPIAKEIAVKNNVSLRRSASIMDTVSCFVQGIIPYGAQLLAAMAIASFAVSPLEIIRHLYYPFSTGLFTFLYIFFPKWK